MELIEYSIKKIGKEKCGKLSCLKYQIIDKTQPNAVQYFWFDAKEYRLQHYYLKAADSTTDLVLTYDSVKIDAPSPTKDFSSSVDVQALQQQVQASTNAGNNPDNSAPSSDGGYKIEVQPGGGNSAQ